MNTRHRHAAVGSLVENISTIVFVVGALLAYVGGREAFSPAIANLATGIVLMAVGASPALLQMRGLWTRHQ
jgi:hypothetical protein